MTTDHHRWHDYLSFHLSAIGKPGLVQFDGSSNTIEGEVDLGGLLLCFQIWSLRSHFRFYCQVNSPIHWQHSLEPNCAMRIWSTRQCKTGISRRWLTISTSKLRPVSSPGLPHRQVLRQLDQFQNHLQSEVIKIGFTWTDSSLSKFGYQHPAESRGPNRCVLLMRWV